MNDSVKILFGILFIGIVIVLHLDGYLRNRDWFFKPNSIFNPFFYNKEAFNFLGKELYVGFFFLNIGILTLFELALIYKLILSL
jgi:cytochrome c-type biogenesis protein CcmE